MVFLKSMPVLFSGIVQIALLLLMTASATASSATVTRAASHEIKAAFIYNFTLYVTWPQTALKNDSSPFRACIMDNGIVGDSLEAIRQKKTNGHNIRTIRINNTADAAKCHLIFIGESIDPALAKKVLQSVEKSPVLTIGDSPNFIHQGGIIGFITADKKLAFEINPSAGKRSGLEISSKLLKLAKIVSE